MASFGLRSAADFLQKLRDERRDFVISNCLDPRHAINAVMTGYHLVEWVYGENAGRPGFEHKDVDAFRETLKALPDSPLNDAGKVTNGTKHFAPERINTGKHEGAFDPRVFQHNGFDVSHLWLKRGDGQQQRAEEFIDQLVNFWDALFRARGLKQYAEAVGRSGKQLCSCGAELRDIDNRGETLTGCVRCNHWWPLAKPPIQLSSDEIKALRERRHFQFLRPQSLRRVAEAFGLLSFYGFVLRLRLSYLLHGFHLPCANLNRAPFSQSKD